MARVMHLASWFLLGCIVSSGIAWIGSVHQSLQGASLAIQIVLFAMTSLAWLADDAIAGYLKLKNQDYYAILIATKIALITGGVLQWLLG